MQINNLVLQVFSMTGEMPPDPRRVLDTYYNSRRGGLDTYNFEVCFILFSYTVFYQYPS